MSQIGDELFPDEDGTTPGDLRVLDSESQTLTFDLGLFVLINTYCPNEPPPHAHALQDEPPRPAPGARRAAREGGKGGHRAWGPEYMRAVAGSLRWARWSFGEGGRTVDVVRMFWPDRKAMCVFLLIIVIFGGRSYMPQVQMYIYPTTALSSLTRFLSFSKLEYPSVSARIQLQNAHQLHPRHPPGSRQGI